MFDPSGQFELQVSPNGRAAADEYLHQGAMWMEGREGSKYVLRFINRSPQRVCVIFSVDGLDTIRGQPAGPNSEGYVVEADATLEVPGWKLDNHSAAEFYFNKIGKSYASASGSGTVNVGVIGAMVFKEQVQYTAYPYMYTSIAGGLTGGLNNPMGSISLNAINTGAPQAINQGIFGGAGGGGGQLSASSSASVIRSYSSMGSINSVSTSSATFAEQSVGTGFGDATQFATTTAHFTRANATVPDAMLVMYYNSAKNLQKMGIQLKTKSTRYDNSTASAFPAYNSGCTPPPGWKA
jgi:hypothetical protein